MKLFHTEYELLTIEDCQYMCLFTYWLTPYLPYLCSSQGKLIQVLSLVSAHLQWDLRETVGSQNLWKYLSRGYLLIKK